MRIKFDHLFLTKKAATDCLIMYERESSDERKFGKETLDKILAAIEQLDLTLPPPAKEGECMWDGWDWAIRVRCNAIFGDAVEAHPLYGWAQRQNLEFLVGREAIVYGLKRKT